MIPPVKPDAGLARGAAELKAMIDYAPPPVRVGDHVECPACYGIGAVYSHTTGKTLLCACCRGNRNVKVEASS